MIVFRNNLEFNYKNTSRFLLLHKLNITKTTYLIPKVHNLVSFFMCKDLEELHDIRNLNYFYFIRFFFGKNAFFSGFNSSFSLGKTRFNFNIQCDFKRGEVYSFLSFYIFDILPYMDNNYIINTPLKSRTFNFLMKILDMNFFSDKKTNFGLFNLKDNLNVKIEVSTNDKVAANMLLTSLKINI